MTRIEIALQRLGQAVERLESVGHERVMALADAAAREEAARLMRQQLSAVRDDYETLQLTSQQASKRVDDAIGKLRALLGA